MTKRIGRMIAPDDWDPDDYYEYKPIFTDHRKGLVKVIRQTHDRLYDDGTPRLVPEFLVCRVSPDTPDHGQRFVAHMTELLLFTPVTRRPLFTSRSFNI